ncbi:MAG TPA: hypothetical protein PLB45_04745 [Bacilli bacterium]|jgi:hypothetical protein|nr:hypothetical protein [Bacilli bacterium]HQC84154.1 hypothetical protein [Bacilli bacterium]
MDDLVDNKVNVIKINNVNETYLYKIYLELISYTEMIASKFNNNIQLRDDIRHTTYDGVSKVISSFRYYSKDKKIYDLIGIDVDLKTLKIFIRVAYMNKIISGKNYQAWSRKIELVGYALGKRINSVKEYN